MKNRIRQIYKDQFFSAAFWVFLGTGMMNFGNYMYHLLMGRLLGASAYGALESIISVLYILSVPTLTLTLVIVKFVSAYKGKNDSASVESIYNYIFQRVLKYGFLVFVVLIIISPLIKNFLHLPSIFLALLLPVTFFLNLPFVVNRSVLHGYSMFFKFSFLNVLDTFFKVALGISLVYIGLGVEGAFGAMAIGAVVTLLISAYFISKIINKKNIVQNFPHKKELFKFAIPTFITTLSITSIFTTDIILVRHFFPGVESGYYAALSILGKIIYFAASPIILVLFPMVSERHSSGKNYIKLLIIALAVTTVISSSITISYFLIPEFMVMTLFGKGYLEIVPLLGLFGIFISLFSLCSVFANFYLSIHQTKASFILLAAAVAQIILIIFFNESLEQVILVSITVVFLLLISLLLYYASAKTNK